MAEQSPKNFNPENEIANFLTSFTQNPYLKYLPKSVLKKQ
jgi:hypothetical protein